MSLCQHVQRFPNLAVRCHVNKASFCRKFTSNGKGGWLNFKQKISIDAEDFQVCLYDVVLFV